MDALQILFGLTLLFSTSAGVYILVAKPTNGNPVLAAALAGLLGGYTAIQVAEEGVMMFFTNHTQNLTGIQVWWDLVMLVAIGLFFIVPRARAQGMNLWGWALLVLPTASIGLLAMCARLFWLENRASRDSRGAAAT
ncbi:hypothetical protein [Erythrobacter sp.]|jgi:hypothetical protein|uniref:hypothetical protein n=1 Tax=Erythrobacter sp. TaxID=1042 RepID=UPI002EA3E523|nr:hypothetical protein [Erythrobacter sp.]